jgi:hypothetical protein
MQQPPPPKPPSLPSPLATVPEPKKEPGSLRRARSAVLEVAWFLLALGALVAIAGVLRRLIVWGWQ